MAVKCRPVAAKGALAALGWLVGLASFLVLGKVSLLILTAVFAVTLLLLRRSDKLRAAVIVGIFAIVGGLYAMYYQTNIYSRLTAFDGKTAQVSGVVTDLSYSEYGTNVTVRGRLEGTRGRFTFLLPDYAGDRHDLAPGDGVSVTARMKKPTSTATFDGENYSRSLGIYLTGGQVESWQVTEKRRSPATFYIKSLRSDLSGKLAAACSHNSGGFLRAMLCADRSALPAAEKAAVYRSGLGHIFAVSGLHVVILAMFVSLLLRPLPLVRARAALQIAFIWSFALFAGFSPSVTRACIMTSVSLTAPLFRRRSHTATSLGLAAMLLTFNCPYTLTSVSFLLSFAAAFAVGVISPAVCRDNVKDPKLRTVISYICINVTTLPLCAIFFSEISTIGIIANIILLPMCSIALVISFIYIIAGCKLHFVIRAADVIVQIVIKMCRVFSAKSVCYIGTSKQKLLVIAGVFMFSILIFAALSKRRKRFFTLLTSALYLTFCITSAALSKVGGKDKIVIIPTDKGYAAVLISGNCGMVFDMSTRGRTAYSVNSVLTEHHVSDIYIYLHDEPIFNEISYEKRLYDNAQYVAGDGEFDVNIFSFDVQDSSVTMQFSGQEICLSDEQITIGGENFEPSGFGKISQFMA